MRKAFSVVLVLIGILWGATAAQAAPRLVTNATLEAMRLSANPDMMPDGKELHRLEALAGQLWQQIRVKAAAAGLDVSSMPERWSSLDYRNPKHRFGYFRTAADWRAYAVYVKATVGVLAQAAQLPPEAGVTIAIELHRAGDDALQVGRANSAWQLFRQRIATNDRFRNLLRFSSAYMAFGVDPASLSTAAVTLSNTQVAEMTSIAPATGQPYAWRDAEGNLHITDAPPPKGASRV